VKVLFLDIDGVLNGHQRHDNGYCGIDPGKVELLNGVILATRCRVVLASAWRYMILGGDMTLKGFGHMLATYGASQATTSALLDVLPADRVVNDPNGRGKLAAEWLNGWKSQLGWKPTNTLTAVALDDGDSEGCDLGYTLMGIQCVRPKSSVGLTVADAATVIQLLNSGA
jgi:hypothetical protein